MVAATPTWLTRLRRRLIAILLSALAALAAYKFLLKKKDEEGDEAIAPTSSTSSAAAVKPEFVLDKREDFYPFVFDTQGICVAHGRDPEAYVGKTLAQVFNNLSDEHEDASELHERFMRAARNGGGWCAYSWRSSRGVLRLKGAYVVGVDLGDGRKGYAGVGYHLCPPEAAGKALGLYGFVCTGEGQFVAHGGSPEFIDKTLADVVAQTANHLTDAGALLERFTTAARLGGGFVEYSWRNHAEAPLLAKGAHVLRVELGRGCTKAAAAVSRGDERTWNGSYQNLAALAAAAETEVETHDALATGGGRARTLFCGVGYFGGAAEEPEAAESATLRWRAAARAACHALKRKLTHAADDDEVASSVADGEGVLAAAAAEALCREEVELPASLAALLKPGRVAAALGLYGIVIDSDDGKFLAHGGNAAWVGSTLHQVMADAGLSDSGKLLQRFRNAAVKVPGGCWVRFNWRTSVFEPTYVKGAHCSRLRLENPRRDALAILCYGAPNTSPPPPGKLPTPPPVAPSRSAVKAAALALRDKLADGAALEAAVRDEDGALATAAAEGLGWEVTVLPEPTLAGVALGPV